MTKIGMQNSCFPTAVREIYNRAIDVKAHNAASKAETVHHHTALVVHEFIKALADAGD